MTRLRFNISWLPLFGAGLQLGYTDTEDLSVHEAVDLLEMSIEQREREVHAAFKKKGGS
ncbi:MAG: hypothetical protein PHU43_11315 [Candidatus Bipolaricaulis sp.]|nr:hypothetical protein [Candidatus Bipolaricaulis sp.]